MVETMEGWISMHEWVTKYGDSRGAAHKRVADGVWKRGYHYASPEGDNAFVHEERCAEWLRERGRLPAAEA